MTARIRRRELAVGIAAVVLGALGVAAYLALASGGTPDDLPRYADGSELGGDDVLISGILSAEGICLYYEPIAADSSFTRGLLIFPERGGGQWDEESGTLTFEGVTYEPGDLLFHAETGIGQGFAWANEPAPGCARGPYWPVAAGARVPEGAGEPAP